MSDVADVTPSNTVISINEPESSTSSNIPIEPTFSEPALEPSLEGQSEGQGDDDNSNRGDHYYSEDSSGSYYSHSSGYSSSGSGYYTDDGDENKFQLLEPSSPSTHDTPTKTRQQLLLGIWTAFSEADRNYLRNTKETNLRLLQQNGISQIGHDQQEKEKELNTETQEKGDYKEQKNNNNTTNTTKNQGEAVESSDNTPVAEDNRKEFVWKRSFSSKMAGTGTENTENTENTETKSTSSTTSKETKESNLNLTNDETSKEMNQEDHHHHHHHKNHKHKHHKKKKKLHLYVDKKFENKIANNKHDRIERAKSVASTFKRKSFIKQNTIVGDEYLDNDQIDSALIERRDSFRSLDRLNTMSTSGDSQAKTELTEEEHISMADAIYTQQELINSAMEEGMIQRWQAHFYPYFSPNPDSQRAKYAESFVMLLVLINIVIMIIQSEQSWFHEAPRGVEILLNTIEYVSFGIFSIEYIIRLWVCTLDAKYGIYGPLQGRLWFMLSRNAIIDFVALIPSILEINACVEFQKQACRGIENCVAPDCVGNVGAGSAIRLWRIVRILKLEHYSNALTTLKGGFTKQSKLFRLILIYPSVAWVIFATLLHYTETLENGASEETMGYFASIPRALFPVLLMLSGEMPLVDFTPAGQLIVGCLAIFSLLIMATVTGIIASGFEEAMREKQNDAHVYHRTHRAIRKLIKEEAKNHRKKKRQDRRNSFFEDATDTPIAREVQQSTEGLDTNGDGNIDTIVLDTNGDGRKDSIVVDTNGDGLFDSSSRL